MKALQWPKLQPLVAKILAVAETSNFWWLFFGKALVTHERRAVAEISMFGGRPLPDDWQLLPVEPTFAQRPLIMIRMVKYKYKYNDMNTIKKWNQSLPDAVSIKYMGVNQR